MEQPQTLIDPIIVLSFQSQIQIIYSHIYIYIYEGEALVISAYSTYKKNKQSSNHD
jgi:hypothetical protein